MSNKLKRFRAMLFFVMAMISLSVSAQTVSGVVKDQTGEPIIGANILEQGTTNGTITDLDGNFTLRLSGNKHLLEISYVGMKSKTVDVKGKTKIEVTLEDDSKLVDEVVVIGYGTVNKRDLTGSVGSVSAKQIGELPVASASEALQGKLAGVSVTTTEGSPDADVKIRVRGGGSLSQDNSPLYIVDGFEVSSISDIAPSDIESIDVLKDASTTAIYGAKGANGVIIVTTKSGRAGKIDVNFGASFGIKKARKLVKVMDPYNYAYYQYELGSTDYGDFDDLEIWKSIKGEDYQDKIFGNVGTQNQYNLSVSGGNELVKFNVSYSHNGENSIMKLSSFRKDNGNAKLNFKFTKWLSLDLNGRISYQKVKGLGSGADTNESNAANSIVANSARFRPINPLAADDDDESSTSSQKNPYERLVATYKAKTKFQRSFSAGLVVKPIKNFTLRSELGYTWTDTDTDQVWLEDATQNSSYGDFGSPQSFIGRVDAKTWKNANTITYDNKKLFGGRDRINVLVGQEWSSAQEIETQNVRTQFPHGYSFDNVLDNQDKGVAKTPYRYESPDENMFSFFGRLNYTLNEKYLLTLTMRADASSKFAEGNRWGYFPSAAFAWRLSEEKFMAGTRDWLSSLKLRLSYGTAGNNRIPSNSVYTTYSAANATAYAPYFTENGKESSKSMLEHATTLSNEKLKWETTITRNIGIDYGFANNRVSGTFDLYWNTTKDLLMKTAIAGSSGYTMQYQNFGQTSNKGFEFTVKAQIVDKKDFGLEFNGNVSYNRNNIDKLALDSPWQSSNWSGSTLSKYEDFRVEEGGRLGEVWGYKTNGFYTVYDPETNPNGELVRNASNTAWVLRDGVKDNSASITGGNYYPGGLKLKCDEDGTPIKQRLGNTVAPWAGGFGFNARYKQFDFTLYCNYSFGNQIVNGTKLATSFYSGSAKGYNLNSDFNLANRYTWIDPATGYNLANPSSEVLAYYGTTDVIQSRLNEINKGASIYNPCAVSTIQLIDTAVEDASFLRIQNITLGYSLPKSAIRKAHMSNVRFYLTGYNLFCFTSYSGADPEVDTSSKKNAMCPGIDYAAYPKSRSYVLGVNVSF